MRQDGSRRGSAIAAAIAFAWALCGAAPATAQTGENILLVSNALSQASEEIADYYARKRGIPNDQLLRLQLPALEEIDRLTFDTKIQQPIAQWLGAHSAQDKILYIVLTKDVPLRITGTSGQNGTVASVDSELTLLYRRMSGYGVPLAGPIPNPLALVGVPTSTTARFSHKTHDIYLVGRLDGYTVVDVKAMIDRAATPSREGNIVLDGKLELGVAVGNKWLNAAAENLRKIFGWSSRIVLDAGQTVLTDQQNVIGFYTWGSNAVLAKERRFGHQFLPGAIAGEYVSTDARTFKEPPSTWVINDTKNPFGGSHQSLVGDLIRDGITGVAGHVAEPFLNGTIRPDALFPAYVSGFNLIESFYMGVPSLSWQTVVVGDPLCAPFGPRPFPSTDLASPIDPMTEMPQQFLTRRLAALAGAGAKPEVARWMARAESQRAKGEDAGVRAALEEATALDEGFAPANISLAAIYEQAQQWDSAIDRYRRVILQSPNNYVALNNLAYALATKKDSAAEALPFAVRAYSASVQDPVIGDTLAWIHHLMGNDSLGDPVIAFAARRLLQSAEVQWHAAVIFAGNGKPLAAIQALDAAVKADPSLKDRADVKALRQRLQPTGR